MILEVERLLDAATNHHNREMSRREHVTHVVPIAIAVAVAIIAAAATIATTTSRIEPVPENAERAGVRTVATAVQPQATAGAESAAQGVTREKPRAVPASTASEAAAQKPLRTGGDVKPPVLIRRVEPEYPSGVRRQPAVIVLEGVVSKDGDVRDLRVIQGDSDPMSAAVVAAVRQWKFRPATRNGTPVDVIYNVSTSIHAR